MSFYHSNEHDAYREIVARWVANVVKPALAAINVDEPMPEEDAEGFFRAIDSDGMATTLPRDLDGKPDWVAFGILLEESARASCSFAQFLVDTIGMGELPRRLMNESQQVYFADYLTGHVSISGAFTETGAGSSQREMKTTAVRRGDEWVINGSKIWISGATHSGALILACRTREEGQPDGFGLFFVERRCGWRATAIPMLGLNLHPTCEVVLEDVVVPDIARLGGQGGNALADVQNLLANGRCYMSAMSLGIGQSAFDAALTYATTREQFGRKIGSFQLVQALLVEMATDLECARLLTYQAFAALNEGNVTAIQTSMAKMFCTEMGVRVASKAIQVFGGMGLARETGVERIFRDARMMTIPDGTTQIQTLIIGRELTGISALR